MKTIRKEKVIIIPGSDFTEDRFLSEFKNSKYRYFLKVFSEKYSVDILSSQIDKRRNVMGIDIIPWNWSYNKEDSYLKLLPNHFFASGSLVNIVRKENPQLLIVFDAYHRGFLVSLVGNLTKTPVIVKKLVSSGGFLNNIVYILCSRFVCVSEDVVLDTFGEFRDKVSVNYSWIEYSEDNYSSESYNESFVVGYLGRFEKVKGTDRFIELVGEEFESDVSFKIAGYQDYMLDEIERLDEKGELDYLGRLSRDEVFSFLSSLDLLIIPSRSEGLCRVAIESLFVDTPVVAWDISIFRGVIKDDFLVSSIEELKKKVEELSEVEKVDLSWFDKEEYMGKNTMKEFMKICEEVMRE